MQSLALITFQEIVETFFAQTNCIDHMHSNISTFLNVSAKRWWRTTLFRHFTSRNTVYPVLKWKSNQPTPLFYLMTILLHSCSLPGNVFFNEFFQVYNEFFQVYNEFFQVYNEFFQVTNCCSSSKSLATCVNTSFATRLDLFSPIVTLFKPFAQKQTSIVWKSCL